MWGTNDVRLERFRALGGAAGGVAPNMAGDGATYYGVYIPPGWEENVDALHRMQNDFITLTSQGGGDPGRAEGLHWQGDIDVFVEEGEDSALQGFPFRRPGSGFFKPGAGLELVD